MKICNIKEILIVTFLFEQNCFFSPPLHFLHEQNFERAYLCSIASVFLCTLSFYLSVTAHRASIQALQSFVSSFSIAVSARVHANTFYCELGMEAETCISSLCMPHSSLFHSLLFSRFHSSFSVQHHVTNVA